jgi:predicted ThiF/HesA family dinucleotide-utilizing enzyme
MPTVQTWGQWNTRLHPLQFYAAGVETVNSDNAITVSGDVVSVAKTSDITVFNIEGKVIASAKNANSVKLSGKGVYIVKAAAGNRVKVKKVII